MREFACQPFVTVEEVLDAQCGCEVTEEDSDVIEAMIDQASDILSIVSGGRVSGICEATVRPVALCDTSALSGYPRHDHRSRFGGLNSIPLRGPKTNVIEVIIDGVTLATSEYGLLNNKYLYRKEGCWPTRNDLTLDSTQVGTFEVKYRFNPDPDRLSRLACIELTCELLRDLFGKTSTLPRGVTSANIQGAQVGARSRAEALRNADEQIPVVARWMTIYARDGVETVSGVWSPELNQFWSLVEVEGPSGS